MMIPTDEVMLKLHAAKSRAAFLSDFLGDPISLPLQVQIDSRWATASGAQTPSTQGPGVQDF
jgi:hypothetical protein